VSLPAAEGRLVEKGDVVCELAGLLMQWNQAFGRLSVVDGEVPSLQLLSAIGS